MKDIYNAYVKKLKEETEKARKATLNRYFKFGEEDGVKTFNKREYLLDQPRAVINRIAKECGIKRYSTMNLWVLVSQILKQTNVNDIIYCLLAEDRHYKIDDEDLAAIKTSIYI